MQYKNGPEILVAFSLEDLLLSVKEHGTAASGNEAKRARRSSAASSSDSDRVHCHVGLHSHIFVFVFFFFNFFNFFDILKMQVHTPQARKNKKGK